MPAYDAEPDDELDPEGPSQADLERFGDEWTRCPHCAQRVYDQAEVCPKCLMPMTPAGTRVPAWVIAAAAAGLLAVVVWILF